MYELTDRCIALRDEAVNKKEFSRGICFQHRFWFTHGLFAYSGDHTDNEALTAAALASVIDNSAVVIRPGELIVGYNFGDGKYGEYWAPDGSEDSREVMRANGLDDDQIDWYFRNCGAARGRLARGTSDIELTQKDNELTAEWAAIGRCIGSNHSVIGYEKVLKYGFEGILKEIDCRSARNGDSTLYRAMRMICVSASGFGERYAAEARRLAACTCDDARKKEYMQIAEICERVPRYPAASFAEAVQCIWFCHIINTWEDYINANSLGRLDQILYPYYRHDIDAGKITKEQAFELICLLWIKLYRDYDVQQSCVGGTNPDGSSAVNELSYMMLDATEKLNFIRCLSVRFSRNTPREFIKRALETVGRVRKGVPFFFNDDIVIPALERMGISHDDACDYTQIGCVETVIPGKSNPHAVSGETNLLKALEYALADGHSIIRPDNFPGIETGDPLTFDTYEKLWNAVLAQMDFILDSTCRKICRDIDIARTDQVKPYKSMLTEDCIENNRDFNNHGARYDYYQVMLGGIPNLADSLCVMKKFVYEQKRYTMRQMLDAIYSNFADEAMRLECINKAPKYGNDIDEVDDIAIAVMDYACDRLDELSKKYGYKFHAQPFTFLWMIDHGRETAATPDGRRSGEIIAYSMSPMQGRDSSGLTALLNSIAKLPAVKAAGTTSAIVEIDPKLFTDENMDNMVSILTAAGRRGLCNVQFNTIDAETLTDAQLNPDKHRNLAVRVSGFSQKFHLLTRELQDHIIARTKHETI